ncbi:MAG: carbohydrate ABC transporter permease [Kiritimatiellia bacterium]|nr:sugar ABC transporter permease [Lentisphaerota bacterium]
MQKHSCDRLGQWLDQRAGLLLSLPALLLLLAFVILPFTMAVYASFTNQSVRTFMQPGTLAYVGWDNYRELLGDGDFGQALFNTMYFVALVVPLQVGLALALAVLVNGAEMWRRMLRISFFMPVITSMAVLAVVWTLLFNPGAGVFNTLLRALQLSPQPFLSSPRQAMLCLAAMSVWQGVGFQMMIFLAAMQSIPPALYEAARIEGAGRWQCFRRITLPMLKNTTIFVVYITTVFAFKLFVQPHLITQGGPRGSTRTLILMLYDEAFTNMRYGKAAAISVMFFVLVLLVTFVQRRLMPREERL